MAWPIWLDTGALCCDPGCSGGKAPPVFGRDRGGPQSRGTTRSFAVTVTVAPALRFVSAAAASAAAAASVSVTHSLASLPSHPLLSESALLQAPPLHCGHCVDPRSQL
jgi:hypothetical protein